MGELSFGDFLSIIQHVSKAPADHPLKANFAAGFAKKQKGDRRGLADEALVALLELRNQLGHQLDRLTDAQATAIHRQQDPLGVLCGALRAMESVLRLPLLLVEEQRVEDEGTIVGRILWLMGESADPEPIEVEVLAACPFRRNRTLYLGMRDGALSLWPMLLWDIADETKNYRLFFVDAVREKELKYRTVEVSVVERNNNLLDGLQKLFRGDRVPMERARLSAGQDFLGAWLAERKPNRSSARAVRGTHPVGCIRSRLDPIGSLNACLRSWTAKRHEAVVSTYLLDGREQLARVEIDQLIVLFGLEEEVRRRLGTGPY